MDIFTTQLAKVVPASIKPEKLRVKGLAKDAKTRQLDGEKDHLDEHERNTVTQQHAEQKYSQAQQAESEDDFHQNHIDKDKDGHIEHLDIYI